MASVRAIKTVLLVIFPDISCLNFKTIRRSLLNVYDKQKRLDEKPLLKKRTPRGQGEGELGWPVQWCCSLRTDKILVSSVLAK